MTPSPMAARFELLHAGYVDERGVGSSVSLVVDGEVVMIVDPGMVADRQQDLVKPLRRAGYAPEDVTHVFLGHHHPDHALNGGMFANAVTVDFWATYDGNQWIDHPGDGYQPSPHTTILLTPGHSDEDASLLIQTDDGVVACTHAWWRTDRTPEVDPFAPDQAVLEASRARLLERADVIVPGHGAPFRVHG